MQPLIFSYVNPYFDKNFWEFFYQLILRFSQIFTGQLTWQQLVSDEIQIIVLVGVAISSALVGGFLMLRKMTMMANSLSHTILLGIVIAFLIFPQDPHAFGRVDIKLMLVAAMITGLITAFGGEFLHKSARLQEDASVGLVFTTLFALGIILLTIATRNAHIGAEVIMGNVDALNPSDCKLVFVVLAINLIVIVLFYKQLLITTFDPGLARGLGFSLSMYNYLLMALASLTVIGAFRAVGVLMVLTFMTGPILTARLLTHRLSHLLLLASKIGSLASILGVALARHLLTVYDMAISTAGCVVCVICLFYLAIVIYKLTISSIQKQRLVTD